MSDISITAPTYRDIIKESLKSSHELEKQIQRYDIVNLLEFKSL